MIPWGFVNNTGSPVLITNVTLRNAKYLTMTNAVAIPYSFDPEVFTPGVQEGSSFPKDGVPPTEAPAIEGGSDWREMVDLVGSVVQPGEVKEAIVVGQPDGDGEIGEADGFIVDYQLDGLMYRAETKPIKFKFVTPGVICPSLLDD
jgi:hypothetical protein